MCLLGQCYLRKKVPKRLSGQERTWRRLSSSWLLSVSRFCSAGVSGGLPGPHFLSENLRVVVGILSEETRPVSQHRAALSHPDGC